MAQDYFTHIKFKHDGVDIKLTIAGIALGCGFSGSMQLAKIVKSTHTSRLGGGRKSPIIARLLALQIQAHAAAFVGCAPMTFAATTALAGPNAGLKAVSKICPDVWTHANPVNVSWKELGVFFPKNIALD